MPRWLNRTVIGVGLASLLADIGYEMATAMLPGFVIALSVPGAPRIVGTIEGVADLLSNIAKLGSGSLGDRIGRRKPFVVAGYTVTGAAYGLWALAAGWPLLLAGKVIAWFGKGVRGPLRNAILAEAVDSRDRGKAFGLHRTADTIGAVIGPLIGAELIARLAPLFPDDAAMPFRWVFAATLIPGLAAAVAFAALVSEQTRPIGETRHTFAAALRRLPTEFRRYLVGVGVFGLGDFSRTLLILALIELLTPSLGVAGAAAAGARFYAWHNACQAVAALPVGWLSDHIGRRGLLVAGYALGAIVSAGIGYTVLENVTALPVLVLICCASGIYVAVEESLEGAMTADLVSDLSIRGTAFGVLGVVNGAGDFVASVAVGALWSVSAPAAFALAAALMLAGAISLWKYR